jgi:hypothetical protein
MMIMRTTTIITSREVMTITPMPTVTISLPATASQTDKEVFAAATSKTTVTMDSTGASPPSVTTTDLTIIITTITTEVAGTSAETTAGVASEEDAGNTHVSF